MDETGKRQGAAGTAVTFELLALDGSTQMRTVVLTDLVIAGWTGRDAAAVQAHVRELEEVGVKPPSSIPVYYRAAVDTLTSSPEIEVLGGDSSGEVEAVLFADGDDILVAVGSDQTDRKVEAYSIAVSKQVCPKPVSSQAWLYADVADHWDSLVLRSYALIDGSRVLYQEGPIAGLLHPQTLFERRAGWAGTMPKGTALFGGTLSAIGGIRAMDRFEMELEDPVLGRRLTHAYDVKQLPVVS